MSLLTVFNITYSLLNHLLSHRLHLTVFAQLSHCLLLCGLLCGVIVSAPADLYAQTANKPYYSVLVLHSYHQGYSWTDSINQGLREVFDTTKLELDIHYEYLYVKTQAFDADYQERLKNLYAYKYADKQVDVLLAVDDAALAFLEKYRSVLFGKEVPIVFCGINEFRVNYPPFSTGIEERVDVEQTLESIHRLQPGLQRLHIVAQDSVNTWPAARLRQQVQQIDGFQPKLVWYTGELRFQDLCRRLREEVRPTDAVLYLGYIDLSQRTRASQQYAPVHKFAQATIDCPAPIYTIWSFFLLPHVTGGMITSGVKHGREAAKRIVLVLGGVSPEDLPVAASANTHLYNYPALQKHRLSAANLPAGSQILLVPPSFWVKHKELLFLGLVVMVVMVGAIVVLSVKIRNKQRKELLHKQYLNVIRHSKNKLREQNTHLQHTNQALDNFVYHISHDLRAPLASVLGLIHICHLSNNYEEVKYYLQLIEENVERLDKFITDVLDYSRNSRTELEQEPIDFQKLCQESWEHLAYMIIDENIELQTSIELPQTFLCDYYRLKIIFNNLLSNAIKYRRTQEDIKSWVRVQVHYPNPQQLQIKITDNGQGISEEYLPNVFKMFYRAAYNAKGSGLGLYIVREVVEKMHGTITVQSTLGKGTSFIILLPTKQPTPSPNENTSEVLLPSASETSP